MDFPISVSLIRPIPWSAPSRRPTGLAMVLRLLRQHLIHCGTGPIALFNRTAILVTDHWDRRLIYESGYDLQAHAQTGGLRTALLHWDGKRWWRQFA